MHHDRIRELGWFVAGAITGAAALYLADVDREGHRMRMAAQRVGRPGRELMGSVRARSIDLRNRAQGMAAGVSARLRHEDVTDEQLAERVRSELGHHTDRRIDISVHNGLVYVAGEFDETEGAHLDAAARRVRGVRDVALEPRTHTREPRA